MKQTLKIGEKYRLKQDVLWYKAGTIFERDSEGQTYITELDGTRYRTLDALQLAICDHRNEEGSEQYFELIKPTKKVKKEIPQFKGTFDLLNNLTIRKSDLIKNELIQYFDDKYPNVERWKYVGYIDTFLEWYEATQPQPIKEESKDIEFEEIEEIHRPFAEMKEKCIGKTLSMQGKVNQLIRNQNKLISLTKRNIK